MRFIRNLLAKMFTPSPWLLTPEPAEDINNNRIYEVDLYNDHDPKPFKTVAFFAENDIQAQFDALSIYGGEYAIADLMED